MFNFYLMNFRSIVERRKVLMDNMTEIKGRIMFSEVKELHVSIYIYFKLSGIH